MRVLIVDDNKDSADVLGEAITAEGHAVEIAYDSLGARECVARVSPDVAILDIDLPIIDGYRLAERLRSRPELSGLRLLAITGQSGPAVEKRVTSAGFHRLFAKPIDVATLVLGFSEPCPTEEEEADSRLP
jgi:CheY-like chemotaxis protein